MRPRGLFTRYSLRLCSGEGGLTGTSSRRDGLPLSAARGEVGGGLQLAFNLRNSRASWRVDSRPRQWGLKGSCSGMVVKWIVVVLPPPRPSPDTRCARVRGREMTICYTNWQSDGLLPPASANALQGEGGRGACLAFIRVRQPPFFCTRGEFRPRPRPAGPRWPRHHSPAPAKSHRCAGPEWAAPGDN